MDGHAAEETESPTGADETEPRSRWPMFAAAGVFLAVIAVVVASFISTGRIDRLLRELAYGNAEKAAAAGGELSGYRAPYAVGRIVTAGAAAPEGSQMAARMPAVVAAIGDAAVEPLAELVENGTSRERGWALRRLGDIGGARALGLLGAALDDETAYSDETTYIRAAAVAGLVRMGTEEAYAVLVGACEDGRATPFWFYYGGIRNGAEELADNRVYAVALRSKSAEVQRDAARGLGELEVALGRTGARADARAVGSLVAALSDRDAEVREAAATALGGLYSGETVEALAALLADGVDKVQWAAAIALAAIGADEAKAAVDVFCADADIDLVEVIENLDGYIAAGEPGTEELLLLALERHGDVDTAVRLYGSRNWLLRDRVVWWARRHGGIEVFDTVTVDDFVIWGVGPEKAGESK